jgi:hypothetical protein
MGQHKYDVSSLTKIKIDSKTKDATQQPSKNRKSPNAANPVLGKSYKNPAEKLGFS